MTENDKKLNQEQMKIIEILRDTGPLVLFELSALYGDAIRSSTMNSLIKLGFVVKSGQRAIYCPFEHSMRKYNEYALKK